MNYNYVLIACIIFSSLPAMRSSHRPPSFYNPIRTCSRFADTHALNPHWKDNNGRTYLHRAHTPAIAEALIKKGALVNAQDHQGNTPLHMVHPKIVPVLMRYNANLQCRNRSNFLIHGNTRYPRSFGDYFNCVKAQENLTFHDLERGKIVWYLHGLTPIIRAITYADVEKFKMLLSYHTDVDFKKSFKLLYVITAAELYNGFGGGTDSNFFYEKVDEKRLAQIFESLNQRTLTIPGLETEFEQVKKILEQALAS